MRTTFSITLLGSALIAAAALVAPATASAREGAQSVGGGVKCYTAAVQQPDGTVQYQRICYKSI